MDDTYRTITATSEGYLMEKRSKFYSFAFPIKDVEDAMNIVDEYRKKFYDARHVCWAYMIGSDRLEFRSNDDGEPSGTAGKPILGQINSFELTDILVIVVRYFGGTLLGTGGLIKAYREAAADAISNAEIIEKTVDDVLKIHFDYTVLNDVMRVLKQFEEVQWTQDFKESCRMTLIVRQSQTEALKGMLSGIYGVLFEGDEAFHKKD